MSKDLFGNTNVCQNCGRTIRGSGWKYCSYCRNSSVRINPWSKSRAMTPEEREAKRQMDKAIGYFLIGLFILLIFSFIMYTIYNLVSTVWNSGALGRIILLSPFLITGLFFINNIWNNSKPYKDKEEKIRRLMVLGILFLMALGIIFFLNWTPNLPSIIINNNSQIVIPTNDTCEYKEVIETNENMQIVYDKQGNRYEKPVEIKNIFGGQGRISFDLVNTLSFPISIRVLYDISHSGGSVWANNEESYKIPAYETINVVNTGSSGILWGTSSVSNIRINYLSSKDLEIKFEKIKAQICQQCNGINCINDNSTCREDSQCGSGICNALGICSNQRDIQCVAGMKKQDNTCVDTALTKFKRNYLDMLGIIFTIVVSVVLIYFTLKPNNRKN